MNTLSRNQLLETVDRAIQRYRGEGTQLESAIGSLFVGNAYGWRVMYLMHNRSTLKKYEQILDVKFQECLPDETARSKLSPAYRALKKVTNFWKAVKGEIPDVKSTQLG